MDQSKIEREYAGQFKTGNFFDQFRHGVSTIMTEVDKVKHIVNDVNNLPKYRNYYLNELQMFDNVNLIQTNTSQLEKMIKNEPINLDSIEQRLLSLRERMSTMEENKILIDHGYKPYKPVDVSTIDDVEMITETQLEDVPDPSFLITPVRSTSKKINLESIETLKPNEIEVMPVSKEITSYNGQSKTPLNLKNCTSSFVRGFLNLQKYNRRESSEPFTFEFLMKEKLNIESLMGKNLNLEKPSNFSSTPITPTLPTSMIRNHTFTINKDYFKSDDILKQHQEQENNYETFEFTPGMKSKVIRK